MDKIYPLVANHGFSVASNIDMRATVNVVPQRWMQKTSAENETCAGIDANQMASLSAMISYTAHKSGQSEYRVERSLADHFHVANAKFLAANDFDHAIRYLADILPQ